MMMFFSSSCLFCFINVAVVGTRQRSAVARLLTKKKNVLCIVVAVVVRFDSSFHILYFSFYLACFSAQRAPFVYCIFSAQSSSHGFNFIYAACCCCYSHYVLCVHSLFQYIILVSDRFVRFTPAVNCMKSKKKYNPLLQIQSEYKRQRYVHIACRIYTEQEIVAANSNTERVWHEQESMCYSQNRVYGGGHFDIIFFPHLFLVRPAFTMRSVWLHYSQNRMFCPKVERFFHEIKQKINYKEIANHFLNKFCKEN